MKKLLLLTLVLLSVALPALGENRVIDNADVLTSSQESQLESVIAEIRSAYSFDVVLLTETSISKTPRYYAADYYDYGGYGYGSTHDGIMLLLVTGGGAGSRDYFILTTGKGERVFNDSVLYDIEDQILPDLKRSDYSSAMGRFVSLVSSGLEQYKPLNRANRLLPILLLAGLGVGFIAAFVLKGQMKTVRRKQEASSYIRDGSFRLTRSQDLYLYTTTTSRKIETSSGGGGGHGPVRPVARRRLRGQSSRLDHRLHL